MATVWGPSNADYSSILTEDALLFLKELHDRFDQRRLDLLNARAEREVRINNGEMPRFLPETAHIRSSSYKAASIPADLQDRRVEITGPVDRKMIINALNSGAKVFMADFEDSSSPTWSVMIDGQVNLRDAVRGTIDFVHKNGKEYKLRSDGKTATLMVRPRGWHLDEAHIRVGNGYGKPMSASLVDFGLYFYHNARELVRKGSNAYFYLPKLESHLEARLWNDVFVYSQARCGLPRGGIRATVLIETILAAYEMDEIIYELREHSAGLNCGRWDYIFSFIKKFKDYKKFTLPDRAQVGMTAPWMANYTTLLIQTCHRRGVHAMGGMAAQIPVKNDAKKNAIANEKVRQDKLREVKLAHDGSWVAHPGLIPIAMEVFNKHMPSANQIDRIVDTRTITNEDLVDIGPSGTITHEGLQANVSVGISYLEAWLAGNGCVPLHHKMEDAATAEISRCQIWQWLKHGAIMSNGKKITQELVLEYLKEEVQRLQLKLGTQNYLYHSKYPLAVLMYKDLLLSDHCEDFLTTAAYPHITTVQVSSRL